MAETYKEIILHAGLGKTGTTSIQNNCFQHREFLAERGIVYPSFDLKGRRLINHSDALIGALCTRTASYGLGFRHDITSDEEAAQLREHLLGQLSPLLQEPRGETLILSGEALEELDHQDLKLVEQALTPCAERFRVLIYVRSPQSAIESMLQQRVQSGQVRVADELLGVVRSRYENLAGYFGERLEAVNFHRALEHSGGLVGDFLERAGVSTAETEAIEFSMSNERVSREAFDLMLGINQRHPRGTREDVDLLRRRHLDMAPLLGLPGQPFALEGFLNSELHQQALDEATWLEETLGFEFPPLAGRESSPLWQAETLFELEERIRALTEPALREAATEYLEELAASQDTQTAAVLQFIAARIRTIKNNPIPRRAEELGPDYFKFAALQMEGASTEMALKLMEIAQALNPEGKQINERMRVYRQRLGEKD